MIPTVADNLKNYLKYIQLEIKQTQKKKDYICYQGHEYLTHTSGKKAVYLTCRKRCGGRAKLMIGLDLIITIQHSLDYQNLVAAQTSNANHAPQTSGFAIAFQTFISNQNNSGAYHVINSDVGIESNGDLPLEVANVLIDLHLNISDPQFIKSQKGKLLLFFQNYIYRYAYQKDDRIHYRCRKVGCKASCKFDGIYTTSGLHEHQNEIGQFEKLRTHKVLEDIVAENPLETRHNIYEKALNKRCLETPSIEMYPEAMPSFVSIKSTIDRLLQKNRPTLPQSLDELVLLPEYITTNKGEIFLINNDNNNNMLVFGTCEMLKLVEICDGDSIYMDGTFYIVPRLYCQLYSIHIMYQEVMILIIYALLPDKNRGTYIELFQIILQFCSMKNI
ncbi:uncharacterized protein LOC135931596 isoform X2 [Gordionus sp. m RMFG-2023]|uniref:uncharacterized protein LOC135931596 isoform X2 n=1 Tax=Gordionus sp. m RMFG-2023 TaxID=3053472 RepID=UPI0031FDED57